MRRFLFTFLLIGALALPGVVLTMLPNEGGVLFIVASDAPRHLYVQVDGAGGARIQSPIIYEYDIGAGELFGRTIEVYGPGSVRVRVWDGGADPSADTTYQLPTRRVYMPLM
jgi:hypothetical protein